MPIVDGPSIRTKSQVPFGDDAQNGDFYKTTNQEVYVPQNGQAATTADPTGGSNVPVNYYPDSMRGTTTQKVDYQNPNAGRTELDEAGLNRVRVTSMLKHIK